MEEENWLTVGNLKNLNMKNNKLSVNTFIIIEVCLQKERPVK